MDIFLECEEYNLNYKEINDWGTTQFYFQDWMISRWLKNTKWKSARNLGLSHRVIFSARYFFITIWGKFLVHVLARKNARTNSIIFYKFIYRKMPVMTMHAQCVHASSYTRTALAAHLANLLPTAPRLACRANKHYIITEPPNFVIIIAGGLFLSFSHLWWLIDWPGSGGGDYWRKLGHAANVSVFPSVTTLTDSRLLFCLDTFAPGKPALLSGFTAFVMS